MWTGVKSCRKVKNPFEIPKFREKPRGHLESKTSPDFLELRRNALGGTLEPASLTLRKASLSKFPFEGAHSLRCLDM